MTWHSTWACDLAGQLTEERIWQVSIDISVQFLVGFVLPVRLNSILSANVHIRALRSTFPTTSRLKRQLTHKRDVPSGSRLSGQLSGQCLANFLQLL